MTMDKLIADDAQVEHMMMHLLPTQHVETVLANI